MSISSAEVSSSSGFEEDKSQSNRSSNSGTTATSLSREEEEQLAHQETKDVNRLRTAVFLILFLASFGVSMFVWRLTEISEIYEFEAHFNGAANIIKKAFMSIPDEHLGAIGVLGVATTAHSIDHYSDWPTVQLTFVQQRFSKIIQITGSLYIGIYHLVSGEDKELWQNFTADPEQHHWMEDGLEYQEKLGLNGFDEMTADDPMNTDLVGGHDIIYTTEDGTVHDEDGPGPYLPGWQTSPVLRQGFVNRNMFRDPEFVKLANTCMETESLIIGGMTMAPPGYANDESVDTRFYATIMSIAKKERMKYMGDPMSDIMIPVFDSFDGDHRQAVAVIRAVFHWRSYFMHILPDNIPDLHIVLENPCDGAYTYAIKGQVVEPLGPGDHHNREYDGKWERTATFEGLEKIEDGSAAGLYLNQVECPYTIRIYPTLNFHYKYHTKIPAIVFIVVGLVRSVSVNERDTSR
jgi:hypothetical protein